jgi:hypothetical protein
MRDAFPMRDGFRMRDGFPMRDDFPGPGPAWAGRLGWDARGAAPLDDGDAGLTAFDSPNK